MQTSVTQSVVTVKSVGKTLVSTAWAWGFEDGARGESVYEGLNYWTLGSRKFAEYEAGHKEGRRAGAHVAINRAKIAPQSDPVLDLWQADGRPVAQGYFSQPDDVYADWDRNRAINQVGA